MEATIILIATFLAPYVLAAFAALMYEFFRAIRSPALELFNMLIQCWYGCIRVISRLARSYSLAFPDAEHVFGGGFRASQINLEPHHKLQVWYPENCWLDGPDAILFTSRRINRD